jgi:hypothetical protein
MKTINIESHVKELAEQKESLRKLITMDVFKRGVHYRVYGKTQRLLLAGVELLKNIYRLQESDMRVESAELGNGHREYQVYSVMKSADGEFYGTGLRVCSTMEQRFCYDFVNTNKRPDLKWFRKRDQLELKGNTEEDPYKFVVREFGGKPYIYERIETENPAKHFNMVSALAHKRASMAAVINAVGASDLFEIESEVLTVDYSKYLEDAEEREIDAVSGSNEIPAEEPVAETAWDSFAKMCQENENAANAVLRERNMINKADTWESLSGDKRSKVLDNLTYFGELIEKAS